MGDTIIFLIDTCPSLGTLTINALAAANEVIITVNPQLLCYDGNAGILSGRSVKIKRRINPDLGIAGILLTMCGVQDEVMQSADRAGKAE